MFTGRPPRCSGIARHEPLSPNMDSKIMCGIKYLNQRRRAGFGLVDFMVALALSTIILAVIGALSSYTARSFAAVANYVDLDQRSQSALDQMTRDIRQVNGLLSYTVSGTSKTLTFQDSDG